MGKPVESRLPVALRRLQKKTVGRAAGVEMRDSASVKFLKKVPLLGDTIEHLAVQLLGLKEPGGLLRPPGPVPLPVVGNAIDVLRYGGLHTVFCAYAEKFGKVSRMKIGPLDTYQIADPELTRQILFDRTDICPNRPDPRGADAIAEAGVGPIFSSGAKHKEFRSIALASFNDKEAFGKYSQIIDEEASELVRQLAAGGEGVQDLRVWSFRLVAEVTCRLVFSKKFGLVSGNSKDGDNDYGELANALEQFFSQIGRAIREGPVFIPLYALLKFVTFGRFTKEAPGVAEVKVASKVMDRYENELIMERKAEATRNGGEHGTDHLGKLLSAKVGGCPISIQDQKMNIQDMLIAGSDTNAATISVTLHQISVNPEIEAKVRAELREVLGDRATATMDDAEQLPYLKLCIRETLRLYPAAPTLARLVEFGDLELDGYHIPQGSHLIMSPYWQHRDTAQWGDDAGAYRPERHLPSDTTFAGRHKLAWIPFAAGPRVCLAANFAMNEALLTVAAVLQHFEIEPVQRDLDYSYSITIQFGDTGIPVRLKKIREPPVAKAP